MDFTLTATRVISAPPDRVFEAITDLERLPIWNHEIPKIVELPASLEVGAQWVVEIHALHTHWNSRATVTELDAGRRRFAHRSQSDDGNPSYGDWLWEVADDPAGARVTVSISGYPRTFWRKALASRIRPRGLERAMNESLRCLDEQLTTRTTTTTVDDNVDECAKPR